MKKPTLYIFSGLPGSGKSTLAKKLASNLGAAHIRIDTIEQGLRDICGMSKVESEGYRLAFSIVRDILFAGSNAIADSVNPINISRSYWMETATSIGANYVNIEVICTDHTEHRLRVENRMSEILNLKLPSWEEVVSREYEQWRDPIIRIDTAGRSIEESMAVLLSQL